MNNTAKKLIEIYANLNELSDDKISEVLHFVNLKKNETLQAKRVGQLAGLCEVSIPENLEIEIRKARNEISSAILSKKI